MELFSQSLINYTPICLFIFSGGQLEIPIENNLQNMMNRELEVPICFSN